MMERIVLSISRFRVIMSSNSTFQLIEAAEFLRVIESVVSQMTSPEGETAEISNLKDLLLLGESVSVGGGLTEDKAIKAFDIFLAQLSEKFESYKFELTTAISGELDSLEQTVEAYDEKLTQVESSHCMLPNAISIQELHQEKRFLSGYKATKDGNLMFVALFDGLPSWHGKRIVRSIVVDELTIMELKVVERECRSVPTGLSVARYNELEFRRTLFLREVALRDHLSAAATVISQHVHNLVQAHSNLVAMEPCWIDGVVMIRFLVSCKHYIPVGEAELPDLLDGFRTHVQQGWFQLTGLTGGLKHQTSLKPGCALSAEQTSGRDSGVSTFGTVGGYVTLDTLDSTSYAVTVGHLFRDISSSSTFPAGSSVVANPQSAQLMYHYINEDTGDQVDIHKLFFTLGGEVASEGIQSHCELLPQVDAIVTCGELVGCLFGKNNSSNKTVDVAVIRVDGPAVPFDGNGWKNYGEEISIPTLEIKLNEEYLPTNVELLRVEDSIGRTAHGYGAFASADIEVVVRDNYCTFIVGERTSQSPIYQCIRGAVYMSGRTMRPGDSGTWFWCDSKTLMGMGIGIEGNDVMILPMVDVVDAVVDIIKQS